MTSDQSSTKRPFGSTGNSATRRTFGKRAKPKAAADIVKSAFAAFGIDDKLQEYAAFPYWNDLVGAEISRVAFPLKINRKRVLVVQVLDAVWSQELALRKEDILRKLQALETGALIEDIRFVTGDPREVKRRGTSV